MNAIAKVREVVSVACEKLFRVLIDPRGWTNDRPTASMISEPMTAWLLCLMAAPGRTRGNWVGGDLVVSVGLPPPSDGVVGQPPEASYRQAVGGNSSADTVTLEYTEPDGAVVTELIDFRRQTQIVRLIVPGEEEAKEVPFQVLCFVSAFTGDFITPEAVMKLRQKHPGTVRVAEKDEGEFVLESELRLRLTRPSASFISSHLFPLCKGARSTTFSSYHELHRILTSNKRSAEIVADLARDNSGSGEGLRRCSNELSESRCLCSRQVRLDWYPCALKYCKNKTGDGEHRCGIRTCKKVMTYRYVVNSKAMCSWDEL